MGTGEVGWVAGIVDSMGMVWRESTLLVRGGVAKGQGSQPRSPSHTGALWRGRNARLVMSISTISILLCEAAGAGQGETE